MRVEIEQNTEEWLELRLGRITGSAFAPLLVTPKKGLKFGDGAITYIAKKVTEALTGEFEEEAYSRSCEWGHAHEDEAVEVYEEEMWVKVGKGGFYTSGEFIGCSPDGIIEDGIIEVKCPYNSVNHYKTISSGEVPKQYMPQVVFNMWVTGAKHCDFISYDHRFKSPKHRLFVKRVILSENEKYLMKIIHSVANAINEIIDVLELMEVK